jgi:hypothetical protein
MGCREVRKCSAPNTFKLGPPRRGRLARPGTMPDRKPRRGLSRFCAMPSSLADGALETGVATMTVPVFPFFPRPGPAVRRCPRVPFAFPIFARSAPLLVRRASRRCALPKSQGATSGPSSAKNGGCLLRPPFYCGRNARPHSIAGMSHMRVISQDVVVGDLDQCVSWANVAHARHFEGGLLVRGALARLPTSAPHRWVADRSLARSTRS